MAPVEARHDERVRVLDGMVKRLRTYVAELQEEVKAKEYEIHRLQGRLRGMHEHGTCRLPRMLRSQNGMRSSRA